MALGGKMVVMVELFGLRPVWESYTEDARANEKGYCRDILEAVPEGGLLVYDLGFFSRENTSSAGCARRRPTRS